jgi:16S rRNA (guanine1207-N2)-methyltransferase
VVTLAYRRGTRIGMARKPSAPPPTPAAFRAPWLDHAVFHTFETELRGERLSVCSRPGVFSWDRLDEGTRLLAETMIIGRSDRVLDLGCGAGILGTLAARLAPAGHVTMTDVDIAAVESARRTAAANGVNNCTVLARDGAGPAGEQRFDRVITNPPFHTGKATDYDTAARFIRDAADILRPGGTLSLVANRFLPYERLIVEAFSAVATVHESGGYKVLSATRGLDRRQRHRDP